ncbi:MAG: hypothetical protein OXH68_09570 [Gammaproteobacteria bacterium]|nr:hypothetical protein [Gammaproteobacteria bacterium]
MKARTNALNSLRTIVFLALTVPLTGCLSGQIGGNLSVTFCGSPSEDCYQCEMQFKRSFLGQTLVEFTDTMDSCAENGKWDQDIYDQHQQCQGSERSAYSNATYDFTVENGEIDYDRSVSRLRCRR